ncbi:MAG: HAMP domain-containing histidine kinase [Oscillospiraceae bacterium]|jgi:signal transduction histidine kinase|nr:HAMP domain-containing histidine kinase [Oscillospiraceae bacterium]
MKKQPGRKTEEKSGQVVSTAARLRQLQMKRIRAALFFSGLITLAAVILGYCYIQESAYSGLTNPFRIWTAVSRGFSLASERFLDPPSVNYMMEMAGRPARTIDATAYFYVLIAGILFVSVFNVLIALSARAFAERQISRQLKPLHSLARTALKLSEEADPTGARGRAAYSGAQDAYGEKRMHELESAIDSIRPEAPDAGLHTGDKDLQGLEEAVNSLLRRMRESYGQQIRFVSDASHELRTPIAVVKGYADMLDRWGKKDEEILDESISAIRTETEHMSRLVEQLLFLARGDSGRTRLNIEKFSLSDMVREVYEESVMIDPGHQWEVFARDEVLAEGDAAMLKQATRILVDNAAKYTPEGERIILRAQPDRNGAPSVVVQDSGIGIAGQDMSRIFDRFYRSDPARNRQQGGTGLGLSIAKWIVDRHHGYFDVVSSEGLGTKISICLPRARAEGPA